MEALISTIIVLIPLMVFWVWGRYCGISLMMDEMEKDVLKMVPNVIKAKNIGGGHFFQWTKPKELSKVLIDFIKD